MKNLFTLLAINIFITVQLSAQYHDYYYADKILALDVDTYGKLVLPSSEKKLLNCQLNSSGDELLFYYNDQNQIDYVLLYVQDRYKKTAFNYNSHGQIAEQLHYDWSRTINDVNKKFTHRMRYSYNSNGLLTEKISESPIYVPIQEEPYAYTAFFQELYYYDSLNSHQLKYYHMHIKNSPAAQITHFEYNPNTGLLSKDETRTYNRTNPPPIDSFESFQLARVTTYSYNTKRKLIGTEFTQYYMPIPNQISYRIIRKIGYEPYKQHEQEYYYDQNLTLIGTGVTTKSFDGSGNMIQASRYSLGGPWVKAKYYNYKYNYEEESSEIQPVVVDAPFDILPNPVQREATLYFDAPEQSIRMHFKLYKLDGQLVYEESFDALKSDNQYLLDLSSIPNGLYIARIQKRGQEFSKKLLIHR